MNQEKVKSLCDICKEYFFIEIKYTKIKQEDDIWFMITKPELLAAREFKGLCQKCKSSIIKQLSKERKKYFQHDNR